jgi:predicted DNA-binding protein (MmcQ/YjbR family)/uncharacterized protein YdhG (YjbR/CyaY superfamily)
MGGASVKRKELERYIAGTYDSEAEAPWTKYPDNTIFRHRSNRKWFAALLKVQKEKLGLAAEETVDVVNLKCDPILAGSLRRSPGIYPAYHMNKERWISVLLDGSVPDETLKMLLDMSFELTAPKIKRGKGMVFNTVPEYFAAQSENGRVYGEKFAAFMEWEFPNLSPKISFSMPIWLVGKKMNEGYVAYSAAKNHFSIHFSSEEFVDRLNAELPDCKRGKQCINIKYGDEQAFETVQTKVKDFLTVIC